MSRQEGTGKKLPPTPTKPSNVVVGKKPTSLPATPGRQLPRTRTPSEEGYYKSDYNEDYNYAYQSQDNLPQDNYTENVYGETYLGLKDSYHQSYTADYTADTYNQGTGQGQGMYGLGTDQYAHDYDQSGIQETTYPTQKTYDQSALNYQEPYQDPYNQTGLDNYGDSIQTQYQEPQYQEPLVQNKIETQYGKQTTDNYQEQYPDQYDAQYNVPTSAVYDQTNVSQGNYNQESSYDHNNVVSESYDPNIYQKPYEPVDESYHEKYMDQYNVPTSETFVDQGYQESFGQETLPVTQGQYEDTYKQDDSYIQDQYDGYKETYVSEAQSNFGQDSYKDDYDNRYQEYTEQYDDSYQESYQGSFDKYKEGDAESERRQSEVPELSVTTPRGQTRSNGYPSSESEYFYPVQDNQEISLLGSSRKKKLARREMSPLQQQNTDSLESRDDELKESFETAVSSMGSSQPRRGFSEYSTAGESSPAAATLVDSPQGQNQTQSQGLGQTITSVTIANHVASSQANGAVVTTAVVHNGSVINGKRLARTDSYQTEMMDEEYQDVAPGEPRRKDSQLSHQSLASQQSIHSGQKPKLTRGDSYASDHMSRDDSYENLNRKGSYAQSVRKDSYGSIHTQDGFKPPLNRTDSYQQRELPRGGTYAQNFNAPQPISRAESYQRGYFKQQDSTEDTDIVLSNTVNGEYKMRDETLER